MLEQREQPVLPRRDVNEVILHRPAIGRAVQRQALGVESVHDRVQLVPARVDLVPDLVGVHSAATFFASAMTWS